MTRPMRDLSMSIVGLAVVCLLLVPAPAPASSHEEPPADSMPVLWVSYVKAEPGKSQELTAHMIEGGTEIYDGLVADGHAVSWGVGQAVNHFPGDDWTHLEWVSFTNWAGVNAFVQRFMAGMQAKPPDEQAADAVKWAELTVHGSHYDEIARFTHLGGDTAKRPGYIAISYFNTHDPMMGAMKVPGLYAKWRAPLMDKLAADGKIIGHGAFTKEIHDPSSTWAVAGYVAMADLSAMDDLLAADRAQMAAMSEADRKEWMEAMTGTMDLGSHFDRILLVLHYHSADMASGGQEGED